MMTTWKSRIEPSEYAAVAWSFGWFFCALLAYYLLRPVRDTMGTVVGTAHMNYLFLGTFITMAIAVPLYSMLAAHFQRRRLVGTVYRFFSVWLIGFSLAIERAGEPSFALGCVFFVWVSVFNLFIVAVFWSVLADLFSSDQGKRLFGLISAGGSAGGLVASLFVSLCADWLGLPALLLLPVLFLEAALLCARRLEAAVRSAAWPQQAGRMIDLGTGGGSLQGIVSVFQSPYLAGICLFLLFGKLCATTVYLELVDVVELQVADNEQRTQLFARADTAVGLLSFAFQAAVASRFIRWIGLSATLCLLPMGLLLGLPVMALVPTLAVTFWMQVFQRSVSFGIVGPAREVLFTVVSREEKYKSKGFIDTFVFRGGDVAAAQLYSVLGEYMSRPGIALWMLPAALGWLVIGWILGIAQTRRARSGHVTAHDR
jgi:AAA family ATP:ADP antiporter